MPAKDKLPKIGIVDPWEEPTHRSHRMNVNQEKQINPLHLQHSERKKLADLRKTAHNLAASLETDEWIREELDPIAIGETQLALLRFIAYVMRVQGKLAEYDRKQISERIEHRRELIMREHGIAPGPSEEPRASGCPKCGASEAAIERVGFEARVQFACEGCGHVWDAEGSSNAED